MQETQETWVWSLRWEDLLDVGNGHPIQYSCLEYSMDRRAWWGTVHGFAKGRTRLSTQAHTYTHTYTGGIHNINLLFVFLLLSCLFITRGAQARTKSEQLPVGPSGYRSFPLPCFLLVGSRIHSASESFPEFLRADSNSCSSGKGGMQKRKMSSQETIVHQRVRSWFLKGHWCMFKALCKTDN